MSATVSVSEVVPLAEKLLDDVKHTAFQACEKRARDLKDDATALRESTAAKVQKLEHDAVLETTKIAVNKYPSKSPYTVESVDGKRSVDTAARARDKTEFLTKMSMLIDETMVGLKSGDKVWVRSPQDGFYRLVSLLRIELTAGGEGGKAVYLDDKQVPVKLNWNSSFLSCVAGSTADTFMVPCLPNLAESTTISLLESFIAMRGDSVKPVFIPTVKPLNDEDSDIDMCQAVDKVAIASRPFPVGSTVYYGHACLPVKILSYSEQDGKDKVVIGYGNENKIVDIGMLSAV